MEQVLALRAAGRAKPGDAVPSVRALAKRLGVNPATVSKAWSRLEAQGVLERRPGIGMVIAGHAGRPGGGPGGGGGRRDSKAKRRAALRPLVDRAVVRGRQLGLADAELETLWRKSMREHPGDEAARIQSA